MKEKFKKILIVNTFGIGDVLFSTPLVRALKTYMPDASIDYMCNKRGQYILQDNKNINDIIIFEKDEFRDAFKSSKIGFAKKLAGFVQKIKRKKYDLVIDLSLGHQISLVLKFVGIKRRVGFNYRQRGRFLTDRLDIDGFNSKHAAEYYLDTLRLIGIEDVEDKKLELDLSDEMREWAADFKRRHGLGEKTLVGIAPGGGKSWGDFAKYRRWDPYNFGFVAAELARKRDDIVFLVFGSEEENNLCATIEEKLGEKVLNLCGELSLSRSIALIRECALLLCNDGGLLHIAVSQGVKTVSIFGPVDDSVYGPFPPSDMHKVAKADKLPCRPCYRNFKHSTCDTIDCLKEIDKNEVLRLVEEGLEKKFERVSI